MQMYTQVIYLHERLRKHVRKQMSKHAPKRAGAYLRRSLVKTVVIASRKGGVGKTTTTEVLGVELARRGNRVMLIDTDPQGSLTEWWQEREIEEPQMSNVPYESLGAALSVLEGEGYNYVLIDTPPESNDVITATVKFADLVIIPVKAGPHDLRAVRQTLTLVKDENKPFVFLLNEVTLNTNITKDVMVALSQHGKLCPPMPRRTIMVEAGIDGRVPQELRPSCSAARDIRKLCDYILEELESQQARA